MKIVQKIWRKKSKKIQVQNTQLNCRENLLKNSLYESHSLKINVQPRQLPGLIVVDLFRLLANCFCFFVVTFLCKFFRRYWLTLKDPIEFCRSLDGTRPITLVVNADYKTDHASQHFDVIAINRYDLKFSNNLFLYINKSYKIS